KRRLEGKGPTPPAYMRPGHPAQRRAAAAAARGEPRDGGGAEGKGRPPAGRSADNVPRGRRAAGDGPEIVARRHAVLGALRADVPATGRSAAPRLDVEERVRESIARAAQAGIPMIEAGRAELDRLTAGAVHQGLALRIAPYVYAHPADLTARAAARGEPPLIVPLDGATDPRDPCANARAVASLAGPGGLNPAPPA